MSLAIPHIELGAEKKHAITSLFAVMLAMMAAAAIFSWMFHAYVLEQAEENITNLLLSHKGIHHYVQNTLIPAYSKYQDDGKIPATFYAPELLSSSFVVRNQHVFYNQERKAAGLPELYYKLAANSPRNPVNKADALEKNLIQMFNEHRDVKSYREIIEVDGRKVLYVAIPFLENDARCMRCHGKREDAPPELQQRYPGQSGFNEKIDEIRAIISIRAPVEHEYTQIYIIGLTIFVGFIAFGGLFLFNTRLRFLVRKRTASLEEEIEERQHAEDILRKNRSMLKQILNTTPQSIFWKDINGVYLGCNQVFAKAAGLDDPDLIIGKTDFDLPWPKEETAAYRADDREVVQSIRPKLHIIEPLQRADGSRIWIDTSKVPLLDGQGKVYGILGVYEDITERKKADEALRESEERFRTLVDNAPEGVFVQSEGRIQFLNPAMVKLLGAASPNDLLGTEFMKWIAPEYHKSIQDRIDLQRKTGMPAPPMDQEYLRLDGSRVPVETTAVNFRFHGKDAHLVFVRDCSDRRKAEAEREKLQGQLQQAQKIETIGTLAGGIAHDFNNILYPLLGFAELLKEDLPKDSPLREHINEILQATLRAKDLVQQILAFSRKSDQNAKPIQLHSIIKEAIKLLRSSIPKTIDIQQDIDSGCGIVMADPTQVHQIIMNLATNAYHAMEDTGGKLKVGLKQVEVTPKSNSSVFQALTPGKYALLTVTDTGVGINKDILDKIFEPYFTTKGVGKGTGLGLSVVHGIVKTYKGEVMIDSTPGKGTEVRVYLPIMERTVEVKRIEDCELIPGGTEKILLVDDEMPIIRVEQHMLEKQGYHVTARMSSLEALTTFQADPNAFDLILTDMTMPNMTGIQLAEKLISIRPDIPIILCTGYNEKITEEKAKSIGIKRFLMKPVEKEDMARVVRKVLDEGKS